MKIIKNQLISNVSLNVLSLLSNVIIGIVLIPYLVEYLGIAAYGLIPLAMIITEYMNLINQSICSSINRYLSIAIQSNNSDEKNKIFNTSLLTILGIIIIQIILFTYPIFKVNELIDIGIISISDVITLFYTIFISYLITLLGSVLDVSMYSKNRLDCIQIGNIIRVSIRAALIYFLFQYNDPNIAFVGWATLAGAITSFIYSYVYYRKLTPEISISKKYYDIGKVKALLSLGGWLVVNQIGFLLLSRVDIFIVNKYIGPLESGQYAIIVQASNLIRSCLGVISGLAGPLLFKLYADGKIKKLEELLHAYSKLVTLLSVIPVSLIVFNRTEFLHIWLGEHSKDLENLIIILIAPLIINIGVTSLFTVNTVYNRLKIPGVLSIIFGFISTISCIILVTYSSYGMYSVAFCSIIALCMKNSVFIPLYTSRIMNVNWYRYISMQIQAISLFFLSYGIDKFIKNYMIETSMSHIFWIVIYVCVMLFFVYLLMHEAERKVIIDNLSHKVKF